MQAQDLDLFTRAHYQSCPWQTNTAPVLFQRIRAANDSFLRLKEKNPHGWVDFWREHFLWCCSTAIFTSNCIEDTGLPLAETQQLVQLVLHTGPEMRLSKLMHTKPESTRIRDVVQHAAAFKHLCCSNLKRPLSLQLILETHGILMANTRREDGAQVLAGELRTGDVIIGRNHNRCVSPALAKKLTEELVSAYNEQVGKLDPFVLAAWLKHVFIHIHPFDDGNGRLSRLLMNWSLLSCGLPFPVSLLGSFNHKAKKNYQNCVSGSPTVGSIEQSLRNLPRSFSALVLESVHSQWCSFWERARFVFHHSFQIPEAEPFLPLPWLHFPKDLKAFAPDTLRSEIKNYEDRRSRCSQSIEVAIHEAAIRKSLECVTYSRRIPSLRKRVAMAELLKPVIMGETVDDCKLLAGLTALLDDHTGTRQPEDTLGMARAYHFLCSRHKYERLSVNLIIETHKLLMSSDGGQLRATNAFIRTHLFPPPSSIPRSLEHLASIFNSRRHSIASQEDSCILAAWLMYELLAIHPFAHGNGRLSRLLLNWVLLSSNTPFPVSFDSELGASKKAHKKLMTSIVAGPHNAGCPSVLATRVLLSLCNTWKRVYVLDLMEQSRKSALVDYGLT